MVLGLRTAIYPVPDLAAGKAWYARILGCEPHFDPKAVR
jgi:catechol 2,3-dioxygenase-like lactoylglutathione lyase family enzyme